MVVTTGKDTAKGAHLDIPLMSLLDVKYFKLQDIKNI